VTIGGVQISKKLTVLAAACAAIMFGPSLGWHPDAATLKNFSDTVQVYLLGQAGVDTLKPLFAPFIPMIAEWLKKYLTDSLKGGTPNA
jgi:hypothetical protein